MRLHLQSYAYFQGQVPCWAARTRQIYLSVHSHTWVQLVQTLTRRSGNPGEYRYCKKPRCMGRKGSPAAARAAGPRHRSRPRPGEVPRRGGPVLTRTRTKFVRLRLLPRPRIRPLHLSSYIEHVTNTYCRLCIEELCRCSLILDKVCGRRGHSCAYPRSVVVQLATRSTWISTSTPVSKLTLFTRVISVKPRRSTTILLGQCVLSLRAARRPGRAPSSHR